MDQPDAEPSERPAAVEPQGRAAEPVDAPREPATGFEVGPSRAAFTSEESLVDLGRAFGNGCPEKPDRLSIEAERAVGRFVTGGIALGLLVVLLVVSIGQGLGLVGVVIGLFAWVMVVGLILWFNERWPVLTWERTFYRVDDGGIEIESGVVWRSVVNVPRSRVQHTDVLEGPIARRYGLATLVIHTAGRSSSTVSLAGLERSVALGIRDVLAVEEQRA